MISGLFLSILFFFDYKNAKIPFFHQAVFGSCWFVMVLVGSYVYLGWYRLVFNGVFVLYLQIWLAVHNL